MWSSVGFSTSAVLHNCYHYLVPELFQQAERKAHTPRALRPIPLPQARATSKLLSAVDLPFRRVHINGSTHDAAFCVWLPTLAKRRWKKRESRISFVMLTL